MATGNSTLVGVFDEYNQAEPAIEQLHNAGVPDNQIRIQVALISYGQRLCREHQKLFYG